MSSFGLVLYETLTHHALFFAFVRQCHPFAGVFIFYPTFVKGKNVQWCNWAQVLTLVALGFGDVQNNHCSSANYPAYGHYTIIQRIMQATPEEWPIDLELCGGGGNLGRPLGLEPYSNTAIMLKEDTSEHLSFAHWFYQWQHICNW